LNRESARKLSLVISLAISGLSGSSLGVSANWRASSIHSSQERLDSRTLGGQVLWRCIGSPKLFPYPLDFVPDGNYLRKFLSDCHCTGITLSYCGILPRQLGQMFVHHFQHNGRKHNDPLVSFAVRIGSKVSGVSLRVAVLAPSSRSRAALAGALLQDFVPPRHCNGQTIILRVILAEMNGEFVKAADY
jgi:hypothetical protein